MNKLKKRIIFFIATLIIFIVGVFVGHKNTYKPSVYSRFCTDEKTGVQYIIVVSKDGGVAIFPRLNPDGTLRIKNKIIFIESDIKEK